MASVRVVTHFAAAALLAATAVSAGACARLHGRAIGPPLETPAPPPRVVPSARPPADDHPIVARPAPATASKPADVPQPAPAAAAPPAVAARPGTDAPEPPPTLQTTANAAAAERRTRTALASATRDLGRIDVRALSPDARAQFDIARRFIAQAGDALNAKNIEFAQQLADKAATLAALLQKR
jgi:hypothetical protein